MNIDMEKFYEILEQRAEHYEKRVATETNPLSKNWLAGVQTTLTEIITAMIKAQK